MINPLPSRVRRPKLWHLVALVAISALVFLAVRAMVDSGMAGVILYLLGMSAASVAVMSGMSFLAVRVFEKVLAEPAREDLFPEGVARPRRRLKLWHLVVAVTGSAVVFGAARVAFLPESVGGSGGLSRRWSSSLAAS